VNGNIINYINIGWRDSDNEDEHSEATAPQNSNQSIKESNPSLATYNTS